MPMSRYEIRNEYSLADPELYRAADKDDPEALLEGVAMAGLVGVLRQLGDLAELAAEIFHDLHEEVMATAARGHGLMIRVQQLEAEVPSIEKAFLSQTDHSSFFYNAGVDWHPNLRMDQNLVTQGDLPRFVMDSYEECRGPPRLFLLDKFDVAGAGACLKRYTDPSFFKVETSAMTSADVQREKKIRKAKKKGPRWRNGETPEVLAMSHVKLHQLFLEEPVENGVSKPVRRAKLKRRPSGFPFDLKTGKSYMEKLLKTPSPEHKMIHEVTVSSHLQLSTNEYNECDLEVLEHRSVSPGRESVGRKRSPPPPDRDEIMLNPFMYETNEVSTDDQICEVPAYLNIVTDGIPSTLDEETGEKDITVDGESKTEGSLTGYQSDEIASEIDNYVDAPSTMDSEMDTDSELRVKNDFTSSVIKSQPLISVENEEHLHSQSSDSHSTGDLAISDEGNNLSKKEMSSFLSSDSPRTSAENPQSEKRSAERFSYADIPEIANDASSYQKTADEDFPVDQLPKPVVSDNTCSCNDALTNNRPDFEQPTSSLCSSDSVSILPNYDSERVVRKDRLNVPKSDETTSTSDDKEKKTNLIIDSPCSPSVSDSKSQSRDFSPRSSSGEHLVDEPNDENAPCISTFSDIICHTTDSSTAISAYLLHEDDYDREDLNQFGSTTPTLNMCNVLSQNRIDTAETISTENPIPGKLDDEVPKLCENFLSDYTDIASNGDNITSKVSKGKNLNDELDNEDSNVVSDVSNHFSCIMEASLGKGLVETSFTNAETVDSEDHYSNSSIDNQIRSEALILSFIENSPDWPEAGLDAHDRDFIPEEETTVNESLELGTPKYCEVVGLQGTGITVGVTENDFVALATSCCAPENLEVPAGMSDTAEKDGINSDRGITGLEVTEISNSADLKSLNEVRVLLDESDSKTDQLETAMMSSSVPAVSDNVIRENANLPVRLDKLIEEHIPCFEDSGLDGLENDKNILSGSHRESGLVEEDENYLSGNHRESGLVEEVDEREAATSDLHRVFYSTVNNDHPKSEVSHAVPNSYLDSEVEHNLDFVDATQIQSPLEQSGLDTEQESFQQSGVENQVSNATSLPIDCGSEETMLHEKIELPPDRIDQELPDYGEISSELLSLLPINHQQMLDHDYHKGNNNSASSFSLVTPSVSGLPGLRNHDIVVSGYPEDPLGFIFPPSNLFSLTNQINLDELPPLPPLPPVQWRMGKLQHASSTTDGERMKHEELLPREISAPTSSTGDVSLLEEMNHSLIQIVPETTSKEEEVDHSSSSLEANSMHETTDLPPKIENEQRQLVMPTLESEVTSPAEEDGVANGSRTVKLPRPCNPLLDDVAALDKSKLRKVTERVRLQIQKVDERDSLLEQIRAKSFNLKPAVASRPSVQGPKTNLKVAAILEKANAIRQALAGSDEDDEDNWSDS
ncbi:hypothetical protein Pfo_004501 [Paulownia fortunei]|nr:hypothetical protein Pfo_004501 [Paulownia fortunei]